MNFVLLSHCFAVSYGRQLQQGVPSSRKCPSWQLPFLYEYSLGHSTVSKMCWLCSHRLWNCKTHSTLLLAYFSSLFVCMFVFILFSSTLYPFPSLPLFLSQGFLMWKGQDKAPSLTDAVYICLFLCRDEIAACTEKAYQCISFAEATRILYFDGEKNMRAFAEKVRCKKWMTLFLLHDFKYLSSKLH